MTTTMTTRSGVPMPADLAEACREAIARHRKYQAALRAVRKATTDAERAKAHDALVALTDSYEDKDEVDLNAIGEVSGRAPAGTPINLAHFR